MLAAIKSANGFALAAVAATLCTLFPPLPSLHPSPPSVTHPQEQLHCKPWQRDVARKAATAPKNFKMAATGECGNALPVSHLPSPFPLASFFPAPLLLTLLLPLLLCLCKKMSVAFCGFVSGFRIAFCLRFTSVTRHAHHRLPPCAELYVACLLLLPPAAPSTCVALQHN